MESQSTCRSAYSCKLRCALFNTGLIKKPDEVLPLILNVLLRLILFGKVPYVCVFRVALGWRVLGVLFSEVDETLSVGLFFEESQFTCRSTYNRELRLILGL